MYLLGCLLVEISIFSTTSVHSSRNLAERYLQALQVLKAQSSKLPKCLQSAVQVLLQTEKPVSVPASAGREVAGSSRVEWRYPCVCDGGLPPPSAHQLLQPLLSIIPFPSYYPALYDFLSKLNAETSAPVKVCAVAKLGLGLAQTWLGRKCVAQASWQCGMERCAAQIGKGEGRV